MFNAYQLLDIKEQNLKDIINCDALPKGFLLNNGIYEIIRLENSCENTFVYKALNLKTKKFVTIKEFFPKKINQNNYKQFYSRNPKTFAIELNDKSADHVIYLSELNKTFIEESKFIEKISNKFSIISVIETFKALGTSYIVLKYNKWPTLNDFLDSKYVFNEKEMNWIVESLINNVEKLHKKGIIHRSINPKNIYFRENEILIDDYGTNDYIRDLKIFDSEVYKNNYYGPEVLMHDGIISTWTDVYSIGKIIIDLIASMDEDNDYFNGLDNIKNIPIREKYRICVERSITYNTENRIADTNEMRKILWDDSNSIIFQKTPKSFVALIALLAIISSIFVLVEKKPIDLSSNYIIIEDENMPSGAPLINVEVDSDFYFITESTKIFKINEPSIIKWEKSNLCETKYIYVKDLDSGNIQVVDLEKEQKDIDINSYIDKPGIHEVTLFYDLKGYKLNKKIIVKFEE